MTICTFKYLSPVAIYFFCICCFQHQVLAHLEASYLCMDFIAQKKIEMMPNRNPHKKKSCKITCSFSFYAIMNVSVIVREKKQH